MKTRRWYHLSREELETIGLLVLVVVAVFTEQWWLP